MATNNFKPFATAANANVTAQADWETLPALLSGFMAGKASSAQINKAIRQASFIAAALAQYTANKSGQDVLDNGDLNGFISKMGTAFGKDFQALDATLTALAGLATGANKLPYFTGTDTASQTDLTSVGRDIIGKSTIADILTYLGLGAGAPAVGIPFFWPHTQMPNNLVDDWNQMTFLKMNGSSFTAAAYPVLAKIWPGLVLPDFRGEFIRIWDDGRGIDSGRNLLTAQSFAMQNITGSFGEIADESKQYAVEINAAYGAFQAQTYMRNIMRNPDFATRDAAVSITFDASRVAQTAAETRPRNISIGFIVRAK